MNDRLWKRGDLGWVEDPMPTPSVPAAPRKRGRPYVKPPIGEGLETVHRVSRRVSVAEALRSVKGR